jgi:hypothetical protein
MDEIIGVIKMLIVVCVIVVIFYALIKTDMDDPKSY